MVIAETPEGEVRFEADSIVAALGMKPLREEALALSLCAPEFHQIGDCRDVKNIYSATNAAYQIAMDLGRV